MPESGYPVEEEVSTVPSAYTTATDFRTAIVSAMVVLAATCQHSNTSNWPSADSDGSPLVSCQM